MRRMGQRALVFGILTALVVSGISFNAAAKSRGPGGGSWDNDPDVDQIITVRICQVAMTNDAVDSDGSGAEFWWTVSVTTYTGYSQSFSSAKHAYSNQRQVTPNWDMAFNIPDEVRFPTVTITLYDHDTTGDDTMDISISPTRKQCILTLDAYTMTWTGDDYNSPPDWNGAGHVSGTEDYTTGSEGSEDQDDCELWFNIWTNDYDHDGLTWYEEAFVYWTYRKFADSDNDGLIDREALFKPVFDPWVANSAGGDYDGDGLSNAYEINTIDRSRATQLSPILADTDGDSVEDARDPEPTKYNRRFAFMFEVTHFEFMEDLPGGFGQHANDLGDIGFDSIFLVSDDVYTPTFNGVYRYHEHLFGDSTFIEYMRQFRVVTVETPVGKDGDDKVLVMISSHGGDTLDFWCFCMGDGVGLPYALNTVNEQEIKTETDKLLTMDLLWLDSCYSNTAFDSWDASSGAIIQGADDLYYGGTYGFGYTFCGDLGVSHDSNRGVGVELPGWAPCGSFESIYPWVAQQDYCTNWMMEDNYPGNLYIN